jgi:hypothetical protein
VKVSIKKTVAEFVALLIGFGSVKEWAAFGGLPPEKETILKPRGAAVL